MKPIYVHFAGALALTLALAACIPSTPRPTPPIQAGPTPRAAPTPTPTPSPIATNWLDRPATAGDWFYRAENGRTLALFGSEEAEADFLLRCDPVVRTITLAYAGEADAPVAMRIRTETATRNLSARPSRGGLSYLEAALPASDRIFDAMALSKGRFALEVAGSETLYLPAWAEVTRVIEDCR